MENTENRNTVLCSALRKTKLWTGPASRCSWNLQLASRLFVRASFYYPCISHNTTDGEEFLPLFPFFLIHRFGLLRDTVAGTIEEIATDAYTYVDVCMRARQRTHDKHGVGGRREALLASEGDGQVSDPEHVPGVVGSIVPFHGFSHQLLCSLHRRRRPHCSSAVGSTAALLSSPLLRTSRPTDDGRSAVRHFGAAAAFQSRTLQSVNCSSINTNEAQCSLRSIHPTTISAKLPPQIWNISQ